MDGRSITREESCSQDRMGHPRLARIIKNTSGAEFVLFDYVVGQDRLWDNRVYLCGFETLFRAMYRIIIRLLYDG